MRHGISKLFSRRFCIRWMLLSLVAGAVTGGSWGWSSLRSMQTFCDQAVLEKQSHLVERKLAEERAIVEKLRAQRKRDRIRSDKEAREERIKWTRVIEDVTAAMQTEFVVAYQPVPSLSGFQSAIKKPQQKTEFWSFQRLAHIQPPEVLDQSWSRNPIDQFILARLEKANLSPNPSAQRQVLGRRLWFDLTGLPPRPEEISAFKESNASDAYEQLVDQLLDKPEFGERWGRIWLDLARYADSNGYEEDEFRPHAYPYRDFAIWAMNYDLPFDVFIRWQIAGDELAGDNPLAVAATGFFTAAPYNTFLPQKSERFDELDDMVSTMGRAMLGLTVGCARCHDHMYDPIPTREYYGLVSIFSETSRNQSYLVPDGGQEYRQWFDPVDERLQEITQMQKARIKEDNISELDYFIAEEKDLLRKPIDPNNQEQARLISLCERCLLITDEHLTDEFKPLPKDQNRFDQLKAELEPLEALLPEQPPMGLTLTGSAVTRTNILAGGDLKRKKEEVGPGFLAALTAGHPVWKDNKWKTWTVSDNSNPAPKPRSALAYWMTDVEQGAGALVARVIVNRLWQHHFGKGLVRTSSDFGSEGELPSHPELLNWLARELVDHNWSLKHIHRLIVTSATYRQSTKLSEEKRNSDPENRLIGRRVPQRITAEMMRDSMLFAAGNLNQAMYGPGVKPPIPRDAVYNTQKDAEDTWPCDYEADRPALWRRSIYVMLKRTVPVPMLRLFDAPDGSFSCDDRKTTTVPTQALALQNAPFVTEQSKRLAERIIGTATTHEEQVQQLFMLTLSREPTQQEVAATIDFLRENGDQNNPSEQKRILTELCHVLFMSNEFFYID